MGQEWCPFVLGWLLRSLLLGPVLALFYRQVDPAIIMIIINSTSCIATSLATRSLSSTFFVSQARGKLHRWLVHKAYFLKKDHAYFYQVQAQIFLCNAHFCDFIMFSKKDIVILRILPDLEIIASAIAAVMTFFKLAVLPELVGKYFSNAFKEPIASSATAATSTVPTPSSMQSDQTVAVCYNQMQPSETVTCANLQCTVKVFHLSCLCMKSVPKCKWHCPTCRTAKKAEKEAKK